MYRPDASPDSGVVSSGEKSSLVGRLVDALVALSVYDVILLGIPLLFAGSLLFGFAFGISVTASVTAAGVVACGLVGYGLFGAPPRDVEN